MQPLFLLEGLAGGRAPCLKIDGLLSISCAVSAFFVKLAALVSSKKFSDCKAEKYLEIFAFLGRGSTLFVFERNK